MTRWRPTAALARASLVAVTGVGIGVGAGRPVMLVLAAPFVLFVALGLSHRPRTEPAVHATTDHHLLREGQGTRSRLTVTRAHQVEHVTRAFGDAAHITLSPADGVVGALLTGAREGTSDAVRGPDVEISPRRWGPRRPADEKVGLTSTWGAWRWGPTTLVSSTVHTLPAGTPFTASAPMPHPVGLVGAHPSRRHGTGTEFRSIRPFVSGDRLRRINWRVSLRTDDLHVVATDSEEDSAVLVVVDALADHGVSGGVDAGPSSLDITVRAAAAVIEHHAGSGDRVGLRTIGTTTNSVGFGSGTRHARRLLELLTRTTPGRPTHRLDRIPLHATAGTVVVIISPLFDEAVATLAATMHGRGLPVIVVDSLPADIRPATRAGLDPSLADLAWRMRRLERDVLRDDLAALGCPVVRWHGPGSLDQVLRRLARHPGSGRAATT